MREFDESLDAGSTVLIRRRQGAECLVDTLDAVLDLFIPHHTQQLLVSPLKPRRG